MNFLKKIKKQFTDTKTDLQKDWKRELARDCIALGSIPFFFIVIIRSIIGQYALFVYQLIIAIIILYIIKLIIPKTELYSSRSLIIFTFTSIFYKELFFTSFAFILWIAILISINHIKTQLKIERKNIVIGIFAGIFSSGLSYCLAPLI